jgi:integrase
MEFTAYIGGHMKITQSTVDSLPAPAENDKRQQIIYWVDGLPGFGVRVTKAGARSYIAECRVNGKTRRVTIGAHGVLTLKQASKMAKEKLVEMGKGIDPSEEKERAKTAAVTLRDVSTDYCKTRQTKKGGALTAKTIRDIERHVKANFGDWADKPIVSITSEMCRNRFEDLSKRSEAQANQAFRILRALINFSIDEENPRLNPVQTLSKKSLWNQNKAKATRIPLDRVGAVWKMMLEKRASSALLQAGLTGVDIIAFLLLTGCRWSEAAQLTWDYVNLEAGTWHLPDPKNHNEVYLPISAPLRAMLEARPRVEGNDYVFPGRSDSFYKDARYSMEQVSKVAGLHLTPHDLRRTFIAIGIELKIEMWKLKLLTNHISKGDVTLDHYTEKSNLRYLSGEAEQIAAWVVQQGIMAAAGNVIQLKQGNRA